MERESRSETAFDQQEISLALWQPALALLKHVSLPRSFSPSLPVVPIVLDVALYSQTYSSIHSDLQYIDKAFNSWLCFVPLCLPHNSKLLEWKID